MSNQLAAYCAHCQRFVTVVQSLAIYRCSKCGCFMLPSQVAELLDVERKVAANSMQAKCRACGHERGHGHKSLQPLWCRAEPN